METYSVVEEWICYCKCRVDCWWLIVDREEGDEMFIERTGKERKGKYLRGRRREEIDCLA
jgi:hypothetical protein